MNDLHEMVDVIQVSENLIHRELEELIARWVLVQVQNKFKKHPDHINTEQKVKDIAKEVITDFLFGGDRLQHQVLKQMEYVAEEYVRE